MKKNFYKFFSIVIAVAILFTSVSAGLIICTSAVENLKNNVVIGYWQNWAGASAMKLRDVNPNWDVINISFVLTDDTLCKASFEPAYPIYQGTMEQRRADFKEDIKFCQERGQKILFSVGGGTGKLSLSTVEERDIYLNSLIELQDYYRFDGIDVDFEGTIMYITAEDTLKNPVSPNIVNLDYILHNLAERYGSDFMVTMAPEHPYVQGAAVAWKTFYGGYLSLIDGCRDIITFIHPQYYNNKITEYNGQFSGAPVWGIEGYNAKSLIKLSQVLIEGFKTKDSEGSFFEGLRADQVAIGVPASEISAGSGYLPISEYEEAVRALLEEYSDFRGIMTWSLNQDKSQNDDLFVNTMSALFSEYAQVGNDSDIIVMRLNSSKAFLNDKEIFTDPTDKNVFPFTVLKKTMVPVRFIENLGATVNYKDVDSPVTVNYEDTVLTLNFGSDIMLKQVGNGEVQRITLPTPAMLIEGKTCVPIREVAENIGFMVEYNSTNHVIVVSTRTISSNLMEQKIEFGKENLQTHVEGVSSINTKTKNYQLNVNDAIYIRSDDIEYLPRTAAVKTLMYESSNNNIATVTSQGRIVAKNAGNATITISSHNGKTTSVNIEVVENDPMRKYEKEVVRLVNLEREKVGLQPLEEYIELSNVARIKSQDMIDNNYFSHTSPKYGSPFDMLKQFGISYSTAGENIAAGYSTPEVVVEGWMNSERHRENILSSSYTKIGVGAATGGSYGIYWTQMFIG